MKTSLLVPGQRMPLLVRPDGDGADIGHFVRAEWPALQALLLAHGAILFRDFGVRDVADFAHFLDATALERLDYTYRSTPRSAVRERIFTASEYPPGEEILLHNENSYQRTWPMKLAFCCLTRADRGGETPLGDMRRITAMIGPRLLERFAERGVRYVRHYRPYVDLPWQTVFQTNDRSELERICASLDLEAQWLDGETLRTIQVSQGTSVHRDTGERLFFNQAHLFHVSSLGSEAARSLIDMFGIDRLPRHAGYGNGDEIAPEELDAVRTAYAANAVIFEWHAGDILLLDNMQAAHGRRAFRGSRKVLAALLEPSVKAAGAGPRPDGLTGGGTQ